MLRHLHHLNATPSSSLECYAIFITWMLRHLHHLNATPSSSLECYTIFITWNVKKISFTSSILNLVDPSGHFRLIVFFSFWYCSFVYCQKSLKYFIVTSTIVENSNEKQPIDTVLLLKFYHTHLDKTIIWSGCNPSSIRTEAETVDTTWVALKSVHQILNNNEAKKWPCNQLCIEHYTLWIGHELKGRSVLNNSGFHSKKKRNRWRKNRRMERKARRGQYHWQSVVGSTKKKTTHTHKLTNTNDSKLFDHTLYVKIQPFLRISHNCNRKYTFNIFLPSKTITHMYFTDDTLGSTNLF